MVNKITDFIFIYMIRCLFPTVETDQIIIKLGNNLLSDRFRDQMLPNIK